MKNISNIKEMKNIRMIPFENKYEWFFLNIENTYLSKNNWEKIVFDILNEYDDFGIMYILDKLFEINTELYDSVKKMLKRNNHTLFKTHKLFEEFDIKNELHPKFLMLRDNEEFLYHRKILENWFEGFQDRDGKIIKEFQTTFHSSFWEFFLFKIFKDLNYDIDFSKSRPDFILKKEKNKDIYVEATTANIKMDGRKENKRNLEDILGMVTPPSMNEDFDVEINESIIRYSNSIHNKLQKYKNEYINLDWIDKENPYVIALSSFSQVNYGREYIHGIIALLYGIIYSKDSKEFIVKESIKKNKNVDIQLGIFNKKEYSDVSAIIFSSNITIGKISALVKSEINYNKQEVFTLYQDFIDDEYKFKVNRVSQESKEVLTDGIWVFHNPNAKNKLALSDFDDVGITNFINKNQELYVFGNLNPTISRLDIPNVCCHKYFPRIMGMVEKYNAENFNFVNYYLIPENKNM